MCSHHQDDIFRGGSRPKPSLSTATGMGNIPTEPYWQGDFQGSHLPSIAPRGWVRCSTAFPPPWQRFRHQQQINITKQTTTKPTNKPASVWKNNFTTLFLPSFNFWKNTNLITQHLNSELSHSLCIFSFDEHLGHFFWGWEGPCSLNMDRSLKHLKKKRCIWNSPRDWTV